jgi:hypothetical protein
MTEPIPIDAKPPSVEVKAPAIPLKDLPVEARLALLEDKVAFLMQVVQVPVVKSALDPKPTLLPAINAYLMIKQAQIRAVQMKDEKNG